VTGKDCGLLQFRYEGCCLVQAEDLQWVADWFEKVSNFG
jgi:hypothetical protein